MPFCRTSVWYKIHFIFYWCEGGLNSNALIVCDIYDNLIRLNIHSCTKAKMFHPSNLRTTTLILLKTAHLFDVLHNRILVKKKYMKNRYIPNPCMVNIVQYT